MQRTSKINWPNYCWDEKKKRFNKMNSNKRRKSILPQCEQGRTPCLKFGLSWTKSWNYLTRLYKHFLSNTRVCVRVRMREMSPCQAPGVWPSPLSSLISGSSGRVIHLGCQRKGCNWLGLFVTDCTWESERDCPCVRVCVCVVWVWSCADADAYRQSCQWECHLWLWL